MPANGSPTHHRDWPSLKTECVRDLGRVCEEASCQCAEADVSRSRSGDKLAWRDGACRCMEVARGLLLHHQLDEFVVCEANQYDGHGNAGPSEAV